MLNGESIIRFFFLILTAEEKVPLNVDDFRFGAGHGMILLPWQFGHSILSVKGPIATLLYVTGTSLFDN